MINTSFAYLKPIFHLTYFLNIWICWATGNNGGNTTIKLFPVGVILDMETSLGRMSNSCINMAVSDFYAAKDHYSTRLVLHPKSSTDVVGAVIAAMELLNDDRVHSIIGPQSSTEAESVSAFGTKYRVPVISFSSTSSALSLSKKPYFIGMSHDSFQSRAIASIIQYFRWKEVVLIYEDTDYGNGIIKDMIDVFQTVAIRVADHSVIDPLDREEQIMKKLQLLSTVQTRVFLVHISSSVAPIFFTIAEKMGLMVEGNAWIITEGLTNMLGSLNDSVINSMYGMLGIKSYIPPSTELTSFWERLKITVHEGDAMNDLKISCLHAYDSVVMLAKAFEVIAEDERFGKTGNTSLIGEELLNVISQTNFRGLSGDIRLMNRHLQSPVFTILNVHRGGGREIGYWTPKFGISQQAHVANTEMYAKSKRELQSVIWPGDSTKVPNGWGKKLKIGVPTKDSFTEFVKVHVEKNQTVVTGYCIDVFAEVIKQLPYTLDYEFVPFQKATGENTSNYDHLLEQVAHKKLDAAIEDITMTARRSKLVEFSLPYTNGGVSMLIPIKYEANEFFFFNPFSAAVWLLALSAYISTQFLDWLSKYLKNSCPPHEESTNAQAPTFPEVDGLNNASRFIMNTTSMKALSIVFSVYVQLYSNAVSEQSLQFTPVDVHDLLKNGDFVGYRKGSLAEMILKQLQFDESRIKIYHSAEEFEEALDKGSELGGVAAIFDEMPYIKLLTTNYCKKYTRVGPIYRMEGFGFAFPKGSPLVSDVSSAILPVVEGRRMAEIERKWLGNENSCPTPIKAQQPRKISIKSFAGVFISVLVIHILSLVQFSLTLLIGHSSLSRYLVSLKQFSNSLVSVTQFWKSKTQQTAGSVPSTSANTSGTARQSSLSEV